MNVKVFYTICKFDGKPGLCGIYATPQEAKEAVDIVRSTFLEAGSFDDRKFLIVRNAETIQFDREGEFLKQTSVRSTYCKY